MSSTLQLDPVLELLYNGMSKQSIRLAAARKGVRKTNDEALPSYCCDRQPLEKTVKSNTTKSVNRLK